MFSPDTLKQSNEIVLEEKIKWNPRSLQGYEYGSIINDHAPQFIRIDRNLRDDTFNIDMPRRAKNLSGIFTVNNQELSGVVSSKLVTNKDGSDYSLMTAHRSLFKNLPLAKTTEISGRQITTTGAAQMVYSMTLFPQIESMNKNIFLEEGKFLKLRAIDSITFSTQPNSAARVDNIIQDGNVTREVHYNTMYIVPRKFNYIEGNQTLFDIYTKNDSVDSSIFADYGFGEGNLTASSLSKSGLKTYFQPTSDKVTISEDDNSGPATKVGEIKIYDNQFFNYDTKKVETGYGEDAVEGLLVPYNFKGEYKENLKFSPNAAFKDLNINMSHHIDQPILDKYDGKIILNIEDTDEVAGPFHMIQSDKIKNLADYDPTISGLERISN